MGVTMGLRLEPGPHRDDDRERSQRDDMEADAPEPLFGRGAAPRRLPRWLALRRTASEVGYASSLCACRPPDHDILSSHCGRDSSATPERRSLKIPETRLDTSATAASIGLPLRCMPQTALVAECGSSRLHRNAPASSRP